MLRGSGSPSGVRVSKDPQDEVKEEWKEGLCLGSGSASQSFELTSGKAQSVWGRMFCFAWVSTGLTAMNLNKLLSSMLVTRAFWLMF